MTKKDNKIGAEKLEGTIKVTIGKYTCRCEYKIVGLTNRTKEDFNRLISKEGNKNVEES